MHLSLDNNAEDALYLLDAYDVFQRLEIAAELVLGDLRSSHSPPVSAHQSELAAVDFLPRHMWSLLRREIQKVVQNLYTELRSRGLVVPSPLTRDVISRDIRCVQHSAYRDIRDFVIFRSVRQAVQYFFDRFQSILA